MSPSDTSLMEDEGADVDGIDQDGTELEGGAADSSRDLNCVSLCFTVAASMAQIWVKWPDTGKGTEKIT